jgi:hypothetical protein
MRCLYHGFDAVPDGYAGALDRLTVSIGGDKKFEDHLEMYAFPCPLSPLATRTTPAPRGV